VDVVEYPIQSSRKIFGILTAIALGGRPEQSLELAGAVPNKKGPTCHGVTPMPSPFPGMNPFLEQDDAWHDFHEKIIPAIAERLVVQVRPDHIVKIDEHVYVQERPPEPRRYLGRAEVFVSRSEEDATTGRPGIGLLAAPTEVQLPVHEIEQLAFVEIRDRRSRELVTVVEVLSPSNYIYSGLPDPPVEGEDRIWAESLIPRANA